MKISEQNVLNRPQALPYLSLVDGARAVAAKDEAIRRNRSKFSFVGWLGPEIFMESAIISLKNSWCGLTFLVPGVCVEVAGLDLGKLVEVEEQSFLCKRWLGLPITTERTFESGIGL